MSQTAPQTNYSPRTDPTSLLGRWWVYQAERFPVFAHGLLIAAFSFSAVSFSFMLRGGSGWPSWRSAVVAFATCFVFFLQLRIADEFKDAEEDATYRPYRPVPRGLVTLRGLAVLFVIGAAVQLALGLWLGWRLVLLLLGVWVYLALMSKEFYVRDWIVRRPITYMWTHMLIMPLVDLYATACDWLVVAESSGGAFTGAPNGLIWFLMVSFFNGLVIEIGRKIRPPEGEEEGVRTYTVLWGRRGALVVWVSMLLVTGVLAVVAAWHIDFAVAVGCVLGVLLVGAVVHAWRFVRQPTVKGGKWIEHLSGLWTLALYLSLGAVPLVWRALQSSGGS